MLWFTVTGAWRRSRMSSGATTPAVPQGIGDRDKPRLQVDLCDREARIVWPRLSLRWLVGDSPLQRVTSVRYRPTRRAGARGALPRVLYVWGSPRGRRFSRSGRSAGPLVANIVDSAQPRQVGLPACRSSSCGRHCIYSSRCSAGVRVAGRFAAHDGRHRGSRAARTTCRRRSRTGYRRGDLRR